MITFVVVGTESEQYKPTTFSWKQNIPHSYHCKRGLKSYEFEMKFSLSLWLILLPLYGNCRLAIAIAPYPVICHFNGVSRFSHLTPILWYWGGHQFERAQFKSLALLNDPQWPFIVSPVVFFSEKTRANISTLPAAGGGTEEPSSKSACLGGSATRRRGRLEQGSKCWLSTSLASIPASWWVSLQPFAFPS